MKVKLLTALGMSLVLVACGQGNEPVPETDTGQEEPEDENTEEEATTESVYLFFPDENAENLYRVERELPNDQMESATEAMNMWLEGPTDEETQLSSFTNSDIELQSIEEQDGVAQVSFSTEFLDIQVGSGTEEMLLQQVALIMKQFGYDQTQILIDGESQEQLFGHIESDEPITAEDPNSYELVES